MNRLQWFYRLQINYPNPIAERRAQGLLVLNLAIFVIAWLTSIAYAVFSGAVEATTLFALAWLAGLFVITVYLVQTRRLQMAGLIYLAAFTALTLVVWQSGGGLTTLGLPVVLAGLLLGRRVAIITPLVLIVALLAITAANNVPPSSEFIVLLAALLVYGALMWLFSGEVGTLTGHIQWLERRDAALTFVGRELEQYPEVQALLNGVSLLLRNTLSAQQVQIYRRDKTDPTRYRLAAGTSLAAQWTATQTADLLPSDSPLLDVLAQDEPRLFTASDLRGSSMLLALGAQAALLFPLKLAGERLGIVEIQGFHNDLSNEDNVRLAGALISQMAVALSRFDLQARLTESESERQRLAARVDQDMQQVQLLNRQLAGGAWRRFFEARGQGIIGYDLRPGDSTPVPASHLTPGLRMALQSGEATVTPTEEGCRLNVPILLRDQPLGAMEFHISGMHDLPAETIQLAETVATRLSLALDNARLIEQVQALANREQQVSSVAERLQQASDLEHLLTLAVQEFGAALGSASTRIRLQLREPADHATPTAGHNGGG